MSQPFLTITFRNIGTAPCRVRGYPDVSISGTRDGRPIGPSEISLLHGDTYARPDPGSHWVVVDPGHIASFTLGTSTALGGRHGAVELQRFTIRLAPQSAAVVIRKAVSASARPEQRVGVVETALRAGRWPQR